MQTKLLILVGRSGSGKSLVANYLEKKYEYDIVRTSDFVSKITKKNAVKSALKLKNDKRLLRDIENEIKKHKKAVLDSPREAYIIRALKQKFKTIVLAINSSKPTLISRLKGRGLNDEEVVEKMRVDDELNIEDAFKLADFTIKNEINDPVLRVCERVDKVMKVVEQNGN